MLAINRKLLREIWHLKTQLFSIGLVVGSGVMTVVTMRGGYEALLDAQSEYYRNARFADVWASLERAPEGLRGTILGIPGVREVETRVGLMARLDLPDLDVPGIGLFVSLPSRGRPRLNDVHLTSGRLPGAARGEVVVSKNFAEARELTAGDSIRAIINGRSRLLRVVGVAVSPEHTYAVPPGALYPDDERYGVLWMDRDELGPAYDMEGAFNEVFVRLAPGANPQRVMTLLDRVLEPYGGLGAYPREDQYSHLILEGELSQNQIWGTVVPGIFLAVAAFLLNLVLGRMITTQRTEIAVLKAFGYTNAEVGWHFTKFALVAAVGGVVVGGVAGLWLGEGYIELYGEYFDFPTLEFRLSPTLLLAGAGVSIAAAVSGAWMAVKRAVALPPAEGMRPASPERFDRGVFQTLGVPDWMPASIRMIVRNLERTAGRAFLSSVGVAFSVSILVVGMFMYDGVLFMIDLQFEQVQTEDLTVTFERPVSDRVRFDLARLDGVTAVEPFRAVGTRLRAGHRKKEVSIEGLERDSRLRRVISGDLKRHPITADGILLSQILAEELGVGTGDSLRVEFLEGERASGQVTVAATVEDFLGVSAIMDRRALQQLEGGGEVVNGARLSIARGMVPSVSNQLKNSPVVAGVAGPDDMLESFDEQLSESLFIVVGFLLAFAGVISVGVIYNGARIALSERGRELSSLRVMGFTRQEVSVLLLGEQAIITLLAIPMGLALGYFMAYGVVSSVETESYRIPFIMSMRTIALAGLVTVVAAVASGWIVRRRIDNLDLIAVLKTRE